MAKDSSVELEWAALVARQSQEMDALALEIATMKKEWATPETIAGMNLILDQVIETLNPLLETMELRKSQNQQLLQQNQQLVALCTKYLEMLNKMDPKKGVN
jgi:hypothetical protein